ncbi:hypothetical protein O9992_16685 [Vibrio lentus]|nr:hypothetical protein [Vibrio lentus]
MTTFKEHCRNLWPQITTENLKELTDYVEYESSVSCSISVLKALIMKLTLTQLLNLM